MALGDVVKFAELHEYLEFAPIAGTWSGSGFSDPATLDYHDVSRNHRLVLVVTFGDTAIIDPIMIGLIQAQDDAGEGAKALWVSVEIDGADVSGSVRLVDIPLEGRLDSQAGYRYVAVDGMGEAPPVGWLLLGVGPRFKPPKYPEDGEQWSELEEGDGLPEGGGQT